MRIFRCAITICLTATLCLITPFKAHALSPAERLGIWGNTFGWWALESQRRMAMDEPVSNVMTIEAHNAFNSFAYDEYHIVPAAGPNQILSIRQQLDAGARSIELDVHHLVEIQIEACIFDNPVSIANKILDALDALGVTKNGEPLQKGFLGDVWDGVTGALGDIVDAGIDLFEDVGGLMEAVFNEIGGNIANLSDGCVSINICLPPIAVDGVPQFCIVPGELVGPLAGGLFLGHEGTGDFGELFGVSFGLPTPVNGIRDYALGPKEIAAWLKDNPGEIVFIDLEDSTAGFKNAELIAGLENNLKDDDGNSLIFRPSDRDTMPGGRWPTRREMVQMGKRVIIFDARDSSFTPYTKRTTPSLRLPGTTHDWWGSALTFPTDSNALGTNGTQLDAGNYSQNAVQNYDPANNVVFRDNPDQFFAVTGDGLVFLSQSLDVGNEAITAEDVALMARNNVNLLKLDFLLGAGFSEVQDFGFIMPAGPLERRMTHAVWSWDESDTAPFRARGDVDNINQARHYVVQGIDSERWTSVNLFGLTELEPDPVSEEYCVACVSTERVNGEYLWAITEGVSGFHEANLLCREEFGAVDVGGAEPLRFVFGGPVNGHRNAQIFAERESTGGDAINRPVWINVNDEDLNGDWTVNFSPVADITPAVQSVPEGSQAQKGDLGFANAAIFNSADNSLLLHGLASFDPDVIRDSIQNFLWGWTYVDPKDQGITPSSGGFPAGVPVSAFPDDGRTDISMSVTDGIPGGVDREVLGIQVVNVIPVAEITDFADETGSSIGDKLDVALEGLGITFSGTFSDVGIYDTHTARFEWGDGNTTQSANFDSFSDTVNGLGGALAATHAFLDAGDYTVKLVVVDDDAGEGMDSVGIKVISPAEAMQRAADDLKTFLSDPALSAETRRNLEKALKWIEGSRDGEAFNGALDDFAAGNWNAGLVTLGKAMTALALVETDLGGGEVFERAKCFLVLGGKSVAAKQLAIARSGLGSADERIAQAEQFIAHGDALREAGDIAGATEQYELAQREIDGLAKASEEDGIPGEFLGCYAPSTTAPWDAAGDGVVLLATFLVLAVLAVRRRRVNP